MPSIFKALASVTVWILFIFGVLALVGGFARMFMGSPATLIGAYLGYAIAALALSVVAAKLRHGMG